MTFDIVSYLKRPFPGFSGLEWDEYYEYAYSEEDSTKVMLEVAKDIAEEKGIEFTAAIQLLLDLETGKNRSLLAENFDLVPKLSRIQSQQKIKQASKRNEIAAIVMRSRLDSLFWKENKDVLASLGFEMSGDEFEIVSTLTPATRIKNQTQRALVQRLLDLLPSSLIKSVQAFAELDINEGEEITVEKDDSEVENETDPLESRSNGLPKSENGSEKTENIYTPATKRSKPQGFQTPVIA